MGDPFMYPAVHRQMSERDVLGVFGDELTAQLVELPVGEWSGPVTSAFGLHLSEVRDAVHRDLVSERTRAAQQRYYEGALARYTVSMEWPDGMEPVAIPGVDEE